MACYAGTLCGAILTGDTAVVAGCDHTEVGAELVVAAAVAVAEAGAEAVRAAQRRHPAAEGRGVLQFLGQRDKALAALDHRHMTPAREGQAEVEQPVLQCRPSCCPCPPVDRQVQASARLAMVGSLFRNDRGAGMVGLEPGIGTLLLPPETRLVPCDGLARLIVAGAAALAAGAEPQQPEHRLAAAGPPPHGPPLVDAESLDGVCPGPGPGREVLACPGARAVLNTKKPPHVGAAGLVRQKYSRLLLGATTQAAAEAEGGSCAKQRDGTRNGNSSNRQAESSVSTAAALPKGTCCYGTQ